jgi:hypothetical protein
MAIRPTPPALAGADPQILRDIQRAANATAVDFGYLVAQASQESSFQPEASSTGSTATGLYQFTEGTWLREFKLHGAQYGYGALAQAITLDDSGRAHVADPEARKQILDLRKDPALSASLAAELARENRAALEHDLGRSVNHTELYLAHFLGAGGASKLISALAAGGGAKAAELLPAAAAANPSVFYDGDGRPRSVGELYQRFAAKFEGGAPSLAVSPDGASPGSAVATLALAGGVAGSPFGLSSLSALGLGGEPMTRTAFGQQAVNALTVAALRLLAEPSQHDSHRDAKPAAPAAPRKPDPTAA